LAPANIQEMLSKSVFVTNWSLTEEFTLDPSASCHVKSFWLSVINPKMLPISEIKPEVSADSSDGDEQDCKVGIHTTTNSANRYLKIIVIEIIDFNFTVTNI
jgi:hypothetical protein